MTSSRIRRSATTDETARAATASQTRTRAAHSTSTGSSYAGRPCGKVEIHHTRGCYNYTAWTPSQTGPVLPTYVPTLTRAQLTLESCAAACGSLLTNVNVSPVAGVEGGERCFCGTAANLSTHAASVLSRPKAECAATPCGGNRAERECGGVGRLLAFDFTCSHSPPPPPPHPRPPLTNCSEATFEAMCESFDNPGDCHWCGYGGTKGQCILKGGVCPSSPPPPPPLPPPPCTSKPPFTFGKSYAAYANASLTTWGGNAVEGDDGKYHMYASAMSYGRNNNALMSDLIPGPCSVGTWVSTASINRRWPLA